MKIVYLGNSLTKHAPSPGIGWYGDWGMAASAEEKDYVHRLNAMLTEAGHTVSMMLANIAAFEREPDTFGYETLSALRDFAPDVLVVRICENTPKDKWQAFGEAYPKLLRYFQTAGVREIFAVGPFWPCEVREGLIRQAAEDCGAHYVSLIPVQGEKYQAIGQFDHAGVAAHPSDAGMEKIAQVLYDAMRDAGI